MISIILSSVLFVLTFIALGLEYKEEERAVYFRPRLLQVWSLASFIFVIFGCVNSVPTGSTGIVTSFGKVEDRSLDAGVHFLAPWKQVITMDNRTQKETLELSCFSSDIQEVTVSYTINYQIDKKNAQEIYKTIGRKYFGTIVEPKALEAVKGVFAKYNAESLVNARGTLSKEIEEVLTDSVEKYNIQIVGTSIENIDFTDAFTNAVEAKQVAEQNKLKAKTEQEQKNLEAEADAKRAVVKAQAKADAAIVAAKADAEVAKVQADSAEYQGKKDAAIMSNIGQQLSKYPDLVNYYKINNWDGKLPETMLSDGTSALIDIK